VTQRSQRVKQPRDSDSFTWVADLTDDKVKSVTFYAIGVTEDSWFGLDESPIMLSLPIANTMRVRDNSTSKLGSLRKHTAFIS
jgi:hypothetical protein